MVQLNLGLRRQWHMVTHMGLNALTVSLHTQPGNIFFQHELQWLLGVDVPWLQQAAAEYRACPAAWRWLSGLRSPSRLRDGIAKSLDVAEGFAIWALIKYTRPRVVVELGSQMGISARLWKEALKAYVPDHELILCDLEDARRFIGDDECTFLLGDARETLQQVFATRQVDLLHNDAHPYDLVRWSLEAGLQHNVPIFTFHDVSRHSLRSTFKLNSAKLAPEVKHAQAENWAEYGLWERHCMAEIFDERILTQDAVANEAWRLQVFDSLFGFGVALRGNLVAAAT